MRNVLIITSLFVWIGCSEKKTEFIDQAREQGLIMLPMPEEYYRKLTGYDSIQIVLWNDVPRAQFCYPNGFNWKNKTEVGDTIIQVYKVKGDVYEDIGWDDGGMYFVDTPHFNEAGNKRLNDILKQLQDSGINTYPKK